MKEEVKKLIKFPVKCDDYGLYILDAEYNMIMQVRGWGRLQYLEEEKGIEAQKQIGNAFAEAFNEKYSPVRPLSKTERIK